MTPEDAYDWYPLQERVGILELADARAIDLDESSTTSITVVGEQDELAIIIPADVVAALDSVPLGELHERINAAARTTSATRPPRRHHPLDRQTHPARLSRHPG